MSAIKSKIKTIKNIFYKLVGIVLAIYLLHACYGIFYHKITHLSNDELQWVKPAKLYKKVSFYSFSGQKASLEVEYSYLYNDLNLFYICAGTAGGEYIAYSHYDYIIECDTLTMNGSFFIEKPSRKELDIYASINGFKTFDEIPIRKIRFGEQLLEDCLVVDESCAGYPENSNIPENERIDKFIICKKYGLIYFRFKNGNEFFRKFN